MKILIISFTDDNFGDNLIRICFEGLLKIALFNHGINESEYSISRMNLKQIKRDIIINSDVIFFFGGGLFGLSYLDFFVYLDEIMKIAEVQNIPVVFSSIGMNNMDVNEEGERILKNFFKYSCIKAVGVRDHAELFKEYTKECSFPVSEVCDPATWTKYIYNLNTAGSRKTKLIGINVVRGGLFKDNGHKWKLADEMNFLKQLSVLLDKSDIDYKFYTNGSILDNNALHYFAKEYGVSEEKCVFPHTTREVVSAVSEFDAVVAFRMHSSIIAYSLSIPSISIVWNDKIPFFYQAIGHPERTLDLDSCNASAAMEMIIALGDVECTEKCKAEYREYLMTVYQYLYNVLFELLGRKSTADMFDFETVAAYAGQNEPDIFEDIFDLRFKLGKAEKQYLARFLDIKEKDGQIKSYIKEQKSNKANLQKSREEIKNLTEKNRKMEREKAELTEIIEKQKKEIELLNKKFRVRVIEFLKRRIKTKV